MKKALSLFVLVLLALYGILRFLGAESPYVAEVRFWKARALMQKIVTNPEVSPPLLFEKARQRFKQILEAYSENATLVRESFVSIGGLFIHEGKYQEAREFLAEAREKHPDDRALAARSLFLTGFTYEKEGDWERALKDYRLIMDQYTDTLLALQTPLYIAHHDLKEDSRKGAERYQEAAHYYRRLIRQYPKTLLGFYAMSYLVKGYQEQKKWDESLDVIEEIVLTYPRALRPYLPMIEGIGRKLETPEKVAAIYESFIESHPDHKDVSVLKKRIARLRKES